MDNFSLSFIHAIRRIAETSQTSVEVQHQLKRCLLDWTGVTCAGASAMGHRFDEMMTIAGDGACSTFLSDRGVDLVSAASINGFLSHVMELDDGHRFGMLHLESPIISAMVAVTQKERINYSQFVKGVIAGYQATVQIARYIQPYHKQKGYHATGTCGAIGVAAAIATAFDFTDEEFENALGAATTGASGLLSVIDSPSELKPLNIAGAIGVGIRAAYIAKTGLRGPVDPLLGKRGFLHVYSNESGLNVKMPFTERPEILNIYFKPYASCRHCHAPVEAALNLRSREGFSLDSIRDILVETYLLGIGGHDSKKIRSISAAKMSTPYCVAVSLLRGSCGLDSFTEGLIDNTELKEIMNKVRIVEDPALTAVSPGKRGARVVITLDNGNQYSDFVENPLGEPEHPMSDEKLEEKYFDLMRFAGRDKGVAEHLRFLIWNIENNYNELIKAL